MGTAHAHGALIYCLVALGRIEEAREVARDMAARYPGETISRNLGHFPAPTPEAAGTPPSTPFASPAYPNEPPLDAIRRVTSPRRKRAGAATWNSI